MPNFTQAGDGGLMFLYRFIISKFLSSPNYLSSNGRSQLQSMSCKIRTIFLV